MICCRWGERQLLRLHVTNSRIIPHRIIYATIHLSTSDLSTSDQIALTASRHCTLHHAILSPKLAHDPDRSNYISSHVVTSQLIAVNVSHRYLTFTH